MPSNTAYNGTGSATPWNRLHLRRQVELREINGAIHCNTNGTRGAPTPKRWHAVGMEGQEVCKKNQRCTTGRQSKKLNQKPNTNGTRHPNKMAQVAINGTAGIRWEKNPVRHPAPIPNPAQLCSNPEPEQTKKPLSSTCLEAGPGQTQGRPKEPTRSKSNTGTCGGNTTSRINTF